MCTHVRDDTRNTLYSASSRRSERLRVGCVCDVKKKPGPQVLKGEGSSRPPAASSALLTWQYAIHVKCSKLAFTARLHHQSPAYWVSSDRKPAKHTHNKKT
ncbi:hypothetical protein BaRGS_00004646 [Batillaria attramentaria]|uniref:Uncharacterized protein n=1 Tax=Batillaria attramentaria TaxID=370345 RepID=A0ABD0LZE2_9CAEN